MNINDSNKVILFFVWLVIMMHLCAICDASRRIFDTTIISVKSNTFDCLIVPYSIKNALDVIYSDSAVYNFEEIRQYCRRFTSSKSYQMFLMENLTETNYSALTFNYLRSIGVTYQQLYQWHAPTDLIEDYIAEKQIGLFVNCSNTMWFGSKCEYTFDSNKEFYSIINDQFNAKRPVPADLSLYTNGTCYEMNNTDCESIICLDWREICDGKIDCKNGYDERHCQSLEMNECNPMTERRCNDGQCIDNPLNIREVKRVCLEEYNIQLSTTMSTCFKEHGVRCENQKCPKLFFSCGDGYCYDGPSIGKMSCPTQRDRRYLEQMPQFSSLILYSHVIFNYTNTQPEYICYNQTLCPYLSFNNNITTTHNNGLICRAFETFINRTYNEFYEMVKDVKRLVRSCSLLPLEYNDLHKTCSMFQCHDHSKCLSFHRLSDGIEDCTNGEDEHQTNVCSYNLTDRFICDNKTKCIFEQLFMDNEKNCNDNADQNTLTNILITCSNPFSHECYRMTHTFDPSNARFYHICNGLVEYSVGLNNNYTDESDCLTTEWSCETYYSKCDQVWNCPDGRDELGCGVVTRSSLYCNNTEHFCLQINTGKNICLPAMNINNGIIDCVGSFDEREFCRNKYPFDNYRRYRCQNFPICISILSICDCKQNCPENDDETTACDWIFNGKNCSYMPSMIQRCRNSEYSIRDRRSNLFCDLSDVRNDILWSDHQYFMSRLIAKEYQIKQQSNQNINYSIIWSCNRGIYVRSTKDPEGFACFCPDHYYGDRCQYQRKRIFIILEMRMLTAFNQRISTSIFVVLLVHTNKSNITIMSHVQFINIPRYTCQSSFSVQLLYPINEPYRSFINNSIHIHMIDRQTFQHQKSWNFPLSFEFLPVQHLFKRLDLPEQGINLETPLISIPYNSCTTCSNNSLCIGHDVSLGQDICICSPNYVGRRCLIPFNPCTNINCSGHGTCQPTGIYHDHQFICLCDIGFLDSQCDRSHPRINVSLARDLTFLSSTMVFLHLTDIPWDDIPIDHHIYLQRLQKETSNLTFIMERVTQPPNIAFLQFYEHQDKFDYYFLFYNTLGSKLIEEFTIELESSHRCRPINELFDEDILKQPVIRRVKNYQRPCLQHQSDKNRLLCFYDDDLMCLCRKDNYTECLSFQTNLNICERKWCNNRGMCVVDNEMCPAYSRCICELCVYGHFCQFSTGGYTLSLDGIIGSHIVLNVSSLSQQSKIVKTSVILISIVVVLGIILNILSTSTFIQKETHEVGCGLYLFTSSIIGLTTMIILICKLILLLMDKQNNVSCLIVEFFLKWCPASCEWLNACVAFERAIAVKRKTQYSRLKSKYFSKWITPIVLILIGCVCMPELFFRRIIIDPINQQNWCVLTLNKENPVLLLVYSTLNILSFLIPLIINLSSGIMIILATLESKQKTNQNNKTQKINLQLIRTQIFKHKYILIGPIILGFLSLPRLILTFIFVCTKLDENSILSLIAYLVGFFPTMAIIFAFVCPSSAYRSALLKSLKRIIPEYIQNLRRSS